MTTTPNDPTTALPGRPPVVDPATWQAAREELLVREKAHTREGEALAAARRRLPMVELDGTVEVVGPDGPVPFLDLFQGRDELVVYKHMWYDGAPHQGQCEGCTTTAWHVKDAVYLNARGVSFAVLTSGPWDEVASYVEFMGYTQPWYSVRDVDAPVGGGMGSITCFLRDGDRVYLTYSTTGRGNEPINGSLGLLDMTPYGRGEAWEDNPEGWPEAPQADSPVGGHGSPICWYWRTDADGVATWGPTSRPVPQWTRPGTTPVETLGGRPEKWDRRLVLDAIFYLVRGGIAWRALPADLPPHQTVYACSVGGPARGRGAGSTQRCVNVRVWPTGVAQCRPRP